MKALHRAAKHFSGIALLIWIAPGCKAGSATTVDAPGAGVTNVKPLEPLVAGERHVQAGAATSITVLGTRRMHGSEVIEVSSGSATEYYDRAGEGIRHLGGSGEGFLPFPELVVPTTVRVGMRWHSKGSTSQYEVRSREEGDTPLGPGVVWNIIEHRADGTSESRNYAEGIGIIDTSDYHFGALVLPLDPPAATTRDEAVLEPTARAQLSGVFPTEISAIVPESGGGDLHLTVSGKGIRFDGPMVSVVEAHTCGTLHADGSFTESEGVSFNFSPSSYGTVADDPCIHDILLDGVHGALAGDASSTVVFGGHYWMQPRASDGSVRRIDHGGGANDFAVANFVEDGAPVYLRAVNPSFLPGDLGWAIDRWRMDGTVGSPERPYGDGWTDIAALAQFGLPYPEGMHIITGTERTTGVRLPITATTRTGLVLRSSFGDEGLAPLVPVLGVSGAPSVRKSAHDVDILSTTQSGSIDRLVLDGDDGAHLEHLCTVALADKEWLVGAVARPDNPNELVIFTGTGVLGVNNVLPLFGGVKTATVTLANAPTRESPAPVFTVTAAPSNLDTAVCWSPTTEPLDTNVDAWTLGGAAPAAVVAWGPQRNCALVVRDLALPEPDLAKSGAFAVVGPVPGVGRIAISPSESPDRTLGMLERDALTPVEGGLVSLRHFFDHTVAVRPDSDPVTTPGGGPESGRVIRDVGGHGVWALDANSHWHLLGPDGDMLLSRDGAIQGVSIGGGVLFPGFYVAPDGTAAALQANDIAFTDRMPPLAVPSAGRLADGTVCGMTADLLSFTCSDPSGARRVLTPVVGAGDPDLSTHEILDAWVPLSDGSWIFSYPGLFGTWRFDPAAMTFTRLDARGFTGASVAIDGTVFAIAYDAVIPEVGHPVAVTITPTAMHAVALPNVTSFFGPTAYVSGVVADSDLLVVSIGGTSIDPHLAYFRWPRPR